MPVLLVLIVLVIGGVIGYMIARYLFDTPSGGPSRLSETLSSRLEEAKGAFRPDTPADKRPADEGSADEGPAAGAATAGRAAADGPSGEPPSDARPGTSVVEARPAIGAGDPAGATSPDARTNGDAPAERPLGLADVPPAETGAGDRGPAVGAGESAGVAPADLGRGAGEPDDLQRISGIGPGIERTLNELGIHRFEQIAAFTPENIAWVDSHLRFKGRIERENWVSQARELAAGGGTGDRANAVH